MDGSKNGTFTDWFENGETESKSIYEMDEWMFTKRWNKNKILIKHFDKKNNADSEYYDTGKIYYDTIFDSPISGFTQTFYNTNGIWLMKNIGADKNKWGGYKNEFHEEELLHYSDILNSTFHNNIISFFIWHLRRTNESIAIDYLMKLLNHQDDTFKAEAIIRLGELKAVKAIPFLETFLKDETRPFRINRFQGMEMSNVYTIAELAQRAIRSISPE
ncbi:MAG: HEAT repeat domain-containing protein [Fimbriimonadaceae bacterium]|nr:HEAT repeat domain-containing protein [Chitinophagales bacterium]